MGAAGPKRIGERKVLRRKGRRSAESGSGRRVS
jgi:hypothetical protein